MQAHLRPATATELREHDWSTKNLALIFLLAIFAFIVMGYHPGMEDDAFYLAAIKRNLNPALFPHDADFFRLQFQATIFDKVIAFSIRLTHLPIAWATLIWQFTATFFVLHGCWRIARRCFADPRASWAATTMMAALLTLPVSGVAINLADQYLHPRTLATATIVAAIVAVLDWHLWLAGVLLAIAFAIHAIMAMFGISFCAFLWWNLRAPRIQPSARLAAIFLFPLGWMFEPASDAWRQAAATRSFYFLARWEWYEWLGVFAPLVLIYAFHRFLQQREQDEVALAPVVKSLLYYGIFQTIFGLAIMLPPSLERLRPFEPMRYLHLLYLLFFLIVGGLLGRYILKAHAYRWILLFIPLSAGMFYAQRQMFPDSEHIELPGAESRNPWVQAFAWIRQNTPVDARFALDPHYVALPGDDYHTFRALAERSTLADYDKDGGMAARVPRLAPRWLREVTALNGWQNFRDADFQRLKNEFGVNWIVLSSRDAEFAGSRNDSTPEMACPYSNSRVRVCRIY